MIRNVKLELGPIHREPFGEPTPLGLIGLALGCAALVPIAFGQSLTAAGFRTAAIFCLLFGAGCQLIAGLMSFANRNTFGGTLFTAFAFNWLLNYWALDLAAKGTLLDHRILLVTDGAALLIFLVMTYGFGFFSKILFAFLLDIDLLYAAKLAKGILGGSAFDLPIAIFTVALALIALWIAFAMLINPTAGRPLFRIPGPLFVAARRTGFDWSLRRTIFEVLYSHWREQAFRELPLAELESAVRARLGGGTTNGRGNVLPDLFYLKEYGALQLTPDGAASPEQARPQSVRLTASGIDLYEQLVLNKYEA
jgi:succinate-acetate transporter protein